jgi:hypothetical protein
LQALHFLKPAPQVHNELEEQPSNASLCFLGLGLLVALDLLFQKPHSLLSCSESLLLVAVAPRVFFNQAASIIGSYPISFLVLLSSALGSSPLRVCMLLGSEVTCSRITAAGGLSIK